MIRKAALLSLALGLAACTDATQDLAGPVEPLGDFKLGHAEVVTKRPAPDKLLVSRQATPQEWIDTVDAAFEQRFRRFQGDSYYHLGIKVEAYSLPPPVVPGKSAVQLVITVWDDAAQEKLTDKPHTVNIIQVFESRLQLTREEQMQRLAEAGAKQVEDWLREQQAEQGWFGGPATPAAEAAAAPETVQPPG